IRSQEIVEPLRMLAHNVLARFTVAGLCHPRPAQRERALGVLDARALGVLDARALAKVALAGPVALC
ncbi:unnamed protein product, partial [Symbiodinium sp. CCMP2592]